MIGTRMGWTRALAVTVATAIALVVAGCEDDGGSGGGGDGGAPDAATLVACLSELDIGLVVDEASGATSEDEPGAAPTSVEYVITAQGVVEQNLDANIFGTAVLARSEADVEEAIGLLNDLEADIRGSADSEGVTVQSDGAGRYGWLLASGPDAIEEDVEAVRGCLEA